MPAKHMRFADWEARQRAADPEWDRTIRSYMRSRGPRRKIPLLLDENLEEEFVDDLGTVEDFRVTVGGRGASDRALWDQARRDGLVIVTRDLDFWNDRTFPLPQSPGVIVAQGRSVTQRTEAFPLAVVRWDLVRAYGHFPHLFLGMKIKASRSAVSGKFWDGSTVVEMH